MPKPPFIPRYRACTHARGPAKLPRFPQYRVRGGSLTQRTMSHFSCIPRGITAHANPDEVLSPDAPTLEGAGGREDILTKHQHVIGTRGKGLELLPKSAYLNDGEGYCCSSCSWKISVPKIINHQTKFGTVLPKRKNKCGHKHKTTPWTVKFLVRNSKLHPLKTSTDLQIELLAAGVSVI
ncbi:hypothetical protein CEXT_628121 [Caerostris extrusa]|uniref:Uncharacterized protein n=1 Tax=Caerostris extrusa TaxID=172846 RepID=A0AAV4UR32_CAEEX|nr:hypothetical protein CEXT_628121 [Caerostris extrusa]